MITIDKYRVEMKGTAGVLMAEITMAVLKFMGSLKTMEEPAAAEILADFKDTIMAALDGTFEDYADEPDEKEWTFVITEVDDVTEGDPARPG